METYFYYNTIRKTIIQFLDTLNGLNVVRYESDGTTVRKYVEVPIKLGTKAKIWYWLQERKDDEYLPMLSVILNSVEFAPDRMGNKLHNIVKSRSVETGTLGRFINPVPYNLGFTVTLWCLYVSDVDQILEQILPYFAPNIFIKIGISDLDLNIDAKVLFQSCSPDVSIDIADEEARILKWNLEFMVQTYLFQPLKSPNIIKKVIQKIYTNKESWKHKFDDTTSAFTSGADGSYEDESLYIKAVSPYYEDDAWEAETDYSIGDTCVPTTATGYKYKVTEMLTPGSSGPTEPTWPTSGTVIDNDLTWKQTTNTDSLYEYEVFD